VSQSSDVYVYMDRVKRKHPTTQLLALLKFLKWQIWWDWYVGWRDDVYFWI